MRKQNQISNEYAELFFKLLLKKAYRNINLKDIKIIHNISDTGILNIIATDGHYSYDFFIKKIMYKGREINAFEISRYSEVSTYSDTKIFLPDTYEKIE